MRNKVAAGLVLVAGAVLAVYLLLPNRTPNPLQLARARTACKGCHAKPAFARASDVHSRHPQVDCATCHPVNPPVVDFVACTSCHGTPRYESPSALHDLHAALSCSHCHGDNVGLKTADRLHQGLRWFGLGIVLFVLAGIAANSRMVTGKSKTEQ